jgi:hypothetical protein
MNLYCHFYYYCHSFEFGLDLLYSWALVDTVLNNSGSLKVCGIPIALKELELPNSYAHGSPFV